MKILSCLAVLTLMAAPSCAAEVKPNLKVLICTGDFGMYAQDRAGRVSEVVLV